MGKGVAVVEHRVSTDPVYCTFDSPDDGFGERSQCRYFSRNVQNLLEQFGHRGENDL